MAIEKNKNAIATWYFLALGWVFFTWPAFASAAGVPMRVLAGNTGGLHVDSEKRESFFSIDEAGRYGVFVLHDDGNALISVGDGSGKMDIGHFPRKKNANEPIFLGDLQINSITMNDSAQDKSVSLLDVVSAEKNDDSDKKEKTTIVTDGTYGAGGEPAAVMEDGVWNVGRDIIFGSKATFEGSADFLSQITFMDRITFADRDMAGSATIKKDKDVVHVTFKNSYSIKPYVVATPNNDFALFRVANTDNEGFDIVTKDRVSDNLQFTWHALAIFEK